jgi:hypothetical protein
MKASFTKDPAPARESAMFTYAFCRSTFERAVKTFAQTLVALLSVHGIGLLDAPWVTALSAAGMAALLSVLTSLASEPIGDRHTPSLVRTPATAEPVPQSAGAAQPSVVPADGCTAESPGMSSRC